MQVKIAGLRDEERLAIMRASAKEKGKVQIHGRESIVG